MQDYKKLEIWQKSKLLTVEIYKVTEHFPKKELYGLTSQIRRSSVSVAANIAEGCGRNSNLDQARFIDQSLGSLFELESHLIIANELVFVAKEDLEMLLEKIDEVRRKTINYLKVIR